MENITKEVLKVKIWTIKLTEYSDGSSILERTNDGFRSHELLGLTEQMKQEILKQIQGKMKPSDEEIIYGVQYNPMIHESVFGCLSLHRSRKEAEMEMEFHKHQRMKEDDYSDVERWTIYEYKLK